MCGRTRRTDVKLVGVQLSLCLLCFSGVPLRVGSAGSTVEVIEDSDAILPCSLSTKEDIRSKLFDWKKDLQDVFLYDDGSYYDKGLSGQDEQFRGRVSHFPDELQHGNASIIIRKTKVADRGNYTCHFPRLQPPQTSHIELFVAPILKDRSVENLPGAAAKPSVKILHQTKDQALLQCEVKGASPEHKVEWKDSSGNILPAEEPLVTERGNYSDIIVNITVNKTDTYYCVATQKEINHEAEADTYVVICASKPFVTILKTEDGMLLQCEVQGVSPKPKVEWKDSSGNIIPAKEPQVTERRGSFDIILQAIVTKADTYRCVATQEEKDHVTEIYAHIKEPPIPWIVAVVVLIILLIVAVVGLAVLYIRSRRKPQLRNPDLRTDSKSVIGLISNDD